MSVCPLYTSISLCFNSLFSWIFLYLLVVFFRHRPLKIGSNLFVETLLTTAHPLLSNQWLPHSSLASESPTCICRNTRACIYIYIHVHVYRLMCVVLHRSMFFPHWVRWCMSHWLWQWIPYLRPDISATSLVWV